MNIALLSQWHVHAKGYGDEFKSIDGVNISAVWDDDVARGKAWAEELGCRFEADLDTLLADQTIDAVSVCTQTTIHEDVIIKCAKAKKHIFTEKVLAVKSDSATRIAEAVRESGVKFTISFPKLTLTKVMCVKSLVDQGKVGKVTNIRIRNAHNGTSANWLPDTFYDKAQCGGGAMMDLGAHPMYLALHFLPNPIFVSSIFTSVAGKGVDDNCVSVIEYPNGAIVVSETAFVSGSCPFQIEVNGELGSIFMSDHIEGVMITVDGKTKVIPEESMTKGTPEPLFQFAEAVMRDTTPNSDFDIEKALNMSKLMDAAYVSYETGKKAPVSL